MGTGTEHPWGRAQHCSRSSFPPQDPSIARKPAATKPKRVQKGNERVPASRKKLRKDEGLRPGEALMKQLKQVRGGGPGLRHGAVPGLVPRSPLCPPGALAAAADGADHHGQLQPLRPLRQQPHQRQEPAAGRLRQRRAGQRARLLLPATHQGEGGAVAVPPAPIWGGPGAPQRAHAPLSFPPPSEQPQQPTHAALLAAPHAAPLRAAEDGERRHGPRGAGRAAQGRRAGPRAPRPER